jgi:3-methyladenine DNA glycosylase AlkD
MFEIARKSLREHADKAHAQTLARFFKTEVGEYGEGDQFIGVRVPQIRQIAKQCKDMSMDDVTQLLESPIHEERALALIILTLQFARGDAQKQTSIYEFYIRNTRYINNWDLVDCSAHKIVGAYLYDKNREPLNNLALSQDMWERRIAIIATLYFIKKDDFDDVLVVAEKLVSDSEDLIHKAVGWMLREVGKRNQAVEEAFLRIHYRTMPRTMLRYAIEKFDEPLRKRYLKGEIA